MWGRETLKQFKAGDWRTEEDLERFVEETGALNASEVDRLLAMLLDPRLAANGAAHRMRCAAFSALVERSLDRSLFTPLVRALPQADVWLRRVLVELIPRVNDVESHRELCRLLGSASDEQRRVAADLLRRVGGPAALGHLTKLVKAERFAGRIEAMDVMVPKARHRTLPLLSNVIATGTPREQIHALRYISDHGIEWRDTNAAVPAVRQAVLRGDRRVASAAIGAFSHLVDEERFFDELESRLGSLDVEPSLIEALGAYRSDRAVALLEHRIRVGPNAIRFAALEGLRRIGDARTLDGLMAAVGMTDPAVRRRATEVLGELAEAGRVDLAQLVMRLLRHRQGDIRRIGAHLARQAKGGAAALTGQLLSFLRDEDWWVREHVLDALVEMAAPGLGEQLVALLKDESPLVRRSAVVGIVRLGDANVLGALVRAAVEDPDWWVREQCVEGMAELGDARAVPYLKKMAEQRPDLRLVSLQALRRLSAHDELLELAELAGDAQADVRLAVLRALSDNPRGKEAAFYVETCRTDDDPRVSRAARELLGQWEMTDRVEVEAAALGLLDRLLVACHRRNGEDLLLEAERVPAVKRLGRMSAMSRSALGDEELRDMLLAAMPAIHREQFGAGHDVDFSYEIKAHGLRFRVNVFRQLTGIGALFRRISNAIPKLAELGLPELVGTFGDYRHGLVLVGGPTGAGKSTTLAALIDHINRASARHIVTIEDPVEFVHSRHRSVINQRELGAHAHSFARALRSMLRQDPDVILIGELRDLETIQFAVNAAETGHLVLATVHTVSAAQSVDRLVHAFAPSDQDLVRSMLGESLRAIVCQQLLQRVDDSERRAAACEVMLNTEAVANLIRKDKTFQIPTVIATHREQGMRLMDQELERLVIAGVVDAEEALLKAVDKNAFASTMVNAGYLEGVQNWETLPPDVRRSVPPPAVRSSIPPGAGSTPPVTMPPPPSIPSPVRHSLYPATGPGRPPRRPRSSGEGEG